MPWIRFNRDYFERKGRGFGTRHKAGTVALVSQKAADDAKATGAGADASKEEAKAAGRKQE